MNSYIFAFLGVLTALAAPAPPLHAQFDKSFGADRVLNDDIETELWTMSLDGITFKSSDIRFLQRDSLVSLAVNNTNYVVNYYNGAVLHSTPLFENRYTALDGNRRYLLQAEPSVFYDVKIVGYYGYLKRFDMDNDFRPDTVVFMTAESFASVDERQHLFAGVRALPGDEHRCIIIVEHSTSYDRGCCNEWGTLLLYDDREAIPEGYGHYIGGKVFFDISPDGKYCVSGGRKATADRVTTYTDLYDIWSLDGDDFVHSTDLYDFVHAKFDPRSRLLFVWSEDRFVQRYVLDSLAGVWHGVDALNLTSNGWISPSGNEYFQINNEQSRIEVIDLDDGTVQREYAVGDSSEKLLNLGLSPRGDVLIVVEAPGRVTAVNIGGAGRPRLPYHEVKRAEDTPQFLPGELGMRSFGGGVHRIENRGAQRGLFTVHNLMGQLVFRTELDGKAALDLNTSNWPRGVYFVTKRSADAIEQSTILITD